MLFKGLVEIHAAWIVVEVSASRAEPATAKRDGRHPNQTLTINTEHQATSASTMSHSQLPHRSIRTPRIQPPPYTTRRLGKTSERSQNPNNCSNKPHQDHCIYVQWLRHQLVFTALLPSHVFLRQLA
ncbi:hypothetical protein ATANTOWER_003797 [Ataeniobius toweri]|uniref:Secreted protein n=1 Tax=Ataeniobius toweri TaxID=208326 RepID=A0ABU7A4F5_9TELE|nr:hypothetical protein [Ataeniobius toweri]